MNMLFRLQATIPVIPFPQLYNYNRHQLSTPLKHFQRILGKLSFSIRSLDTVHSLMPFGRRSRSRNTWRCMPQSGEYRQTKSSRLSQGTVFFIVNCLFVYVSNYRFIILLSIYLSRHSIYLYIIFPFMYKVFFHN